MGAERDPEYAAAVAEFDGYDADWTRGDPVELRRLYADARARLAGDAADGIVTPFEGPVPGLRFEPRVGHGAPVIVWFHGGSWTVGSPETHRVPCSHLAALTGLPVWSFDYRLGPEHPWPAQRKDAVLAARRGLHEAERIFLAGDSAGAAMAFWADAALDTDERARVAGVLGFYGGYGINPDALQEDEPGGLSASDIRASLERLGPVDALLSDPHFDIASFAGQGAPVWLACGTADPLLGGTEALGQRLKAVEREVRIDRVPGLGHSYLHYVVRVTMARASLERAAAWIGEHAER